MDVVICIQSILCILEEQSSVIFVNENENVEKRENNEFVNEKIMKTKTKLKRKNRKRLKKEKTKTKMPK